MTILTIKQRVQRGAEYLDAYVPDWVERIDLDELRMQMPCSCVLGQLVGDYDEVACQPWSKQEHVDWINKQRRFERVGIPAVLTYPQAAARGFHLPESQMQNDNTWDRLTAEWRRVILERRGSAQADPE